MKKLCLLLFFALSIAQVLAQKPIKSGEVWLDTNGKIINAHGGGMLYHNNKYYWFGEHKIEGTAGNVAQVGFHCYSSVDLYSWKDEGIVLSVSNDNASPIRKGCIMERPKVIYNAKTKKFVMWFHHELFGSEYKSAMSGVAVADKVTGPYTYFKSYRPNAKQWPVNVLPSHKLPAHDSVNRYFCGGPNCMPVHVDSLNILGRDFNGGQMARDMSLFVDDDGKAYHIYASEENSTMHIAQLSDDYLSHTGPFARVFIFRFMEGPAIFKQNGKYYFMGSGCTGWNPNAARSAVSDSIFGPWKELGNPAEGKDSEVTFHSQSTFIFPVAGKKNAFTYMGDRWNPDNAIDGRYVWLPVIFDSGRFKIHWKDQWDISVFVNRTD